MAALLTEYSAFLTDNRRMSPHSVRAYQATAERLSVFLELHWGGLVDRAALTRISAADLRSFLADRRGDGLTNRSTARELSAIRHFLRFALGDNASLPVLKGPRVQRSLPRPVNPDDVVALAEDVAQSPTDSWIGARDWAVLLLLYGSGLRVSEATGLQGDVLPLGMTLRVTGKRNKIRIVPLIDSVKQAIEDYLSLCPYPVMRDEPLFKGASGGPLSPALIAARSKAHAVGWACPNARRHMPCATALQPICWQAERIYGVCRSCSATPACHRRRFIRR
jgi:integrase/recombinase XerC